jgi:hypothetical protein
MVMCEFRFRRNARFIVFRSAGEIGVDIFFRERHELLLLSKEVVETCAHRYVQYTQRGRGMVEAYVQRREKRDASDFNESGSHQGATGRASHVTCGKTILNNCLLGLGKFNLAIAPGGDLREMSGGELD